MKPTTFKHRKLLLAVIAIGLTIGLVSWDYKQSPGKYQQSLNDTTPKKKTDRDKKVRDLDDVLDELNAVDFKVEMEKAQKEIAEAMKNFNGDKIKLEIEKAMKEVDMAKIQQEVATSLAKVDFEKIQKEVNEAMKSFDMAKIQKEVSESLAKVNWNEVKEEMDKVKDIDFKKLEVDMKKLGEEMKDLGPKIEKELANAKVEVEKAKEEIKEYKTFVDGLDKDGLINKKEAYKIKHKDGELFINDKKVTEQTYNKYRSFLEKRKSFNIEKTDDDFDIDMD
ncbi:hypothetical protein CAP36_11155 [Chitinophagaceae bacterium IBVUCB2]|nr:hypothetical protein CAP36_11155 [Chitinophagaceae bacterium IBVUCB2]